MNNLIPLTIITITKNNADQLRDTIKSVDRLCRKYQIKQIVIDTSSPALQKVNSVFCKNYPWVVYISGNWSGIAKSYNYGISLVKKGWIWLLNASDYLHPKLDIHLFINTLLNCKTNIMIYQAEGFQSGKLWIHPDIKRQVLPLGWIPQPGVIIKKEIFNKIGNFNEKYRICLDTEYWLRLFSVGQTSYTTHGFPIVLYDETGISATKLNIVGREMLDILFLRYPVFTLKYLIKYPGVMSRIIFNSVVNVIK